jgi:hypothetical protein
MFVEELKQFQQTQWSTNVIKDRLNDFLFNMDTIDLQFCCPDCYDWVTEGIFIVTVEIRLII